MSSVACLQCSLIRRVRFSNEPTWASLYVERYLALTSAARAKKTLHLFDTFENILPTDNSVDNHRKGGFADTSFQSVQRLMDGCGDVRFGYHRQVRYYELRKASKRACQSFQKVSVALSTEKCGRVAWLGQWLCILPSCAV